MIVIVYSCIQRKEPVRIAYAGGFLLAAAGISFIIFLSVISNLGPVGQGWEEPMMMQTLLNTSIFTPAGIIITAVGLVINHRAETLKTAYAGLALLAAAILFFILFLILQRIGISALEPVAQALFISVLAMLPVGSLITVAGLILHSIKSR